MPPPLREDAADASLWVFGYGSLMWRPAFRYVERRPAQVQGWARRFWQGSTDHRGVPGAPGRVVTLQREAGTLCRGLAFRIEPAQQGTVLEGLDHRERGGFERVRLPVRLDAEEGGVEAVSYVATATNPNYLGPAPLDAVVDQVRRSRGPSGSNAEYVLELAAALRAIDAHDPHVFELERLLRESAPRGSQGE